MSLSIPVSPSFDPETIGASVPKKKPRRVTETSPVAPGLPTDPPPPRSTVAPVAPVAPNREPITPAAGPGPAPGDLGAGRQAAERAPDDLLLEQGGILLPRGRIQIEPSVEYSRFSSDRVTISGFRIFDAVVIGIVRVDDLHTGSASVG